MAKNRLTDEEIRAQISRTRKRAEVGVETEPRATRVRYDPASARMEVEFSNGCMFAFPVAHVEGLRGASSDALAEVEIEMDGEGLHWEGLDADLLVPQLVRGVFGSRRWMSEIGRTLGSVRSDAKARAARANGHKGGRPRRGSS